MPKFIVVISKDGDTETWGSLTAACKKHKEFQYPTIKKLKYPFEHKGWSFDKLEYNPTK